MLPTDKTDDKDEENATPVDGDIINGDVCEPARELGERMAVLAAGGTHHSAGGRHTLSHSQTKTDRGRWDHAVPCQGEIAAFLERGGAIRLEFVFYLSIPLR